MKVLVVEDSTINARVAEKILEQLNCKVEIVNNGKECLDIIQNNTYDLIFMDVMMPVMDGIEAFNKLKEQENFNTPVVTLTADNENGACEKYLSIGFNDYLSKPIMKEDIKKIIDKYQK